VGETLGAVSAELGLGDSVTLVALSGQWGEIVGPALAAHTELRSLREHTLTIAVHAGPWATELKYLRSELRDRVAAVIGADRIHDVRLVVEAPAPGDR
jgi:predicted nucleic acid-binding Zn ribbon protein